MAPRVVPVLDDSYDNNRVIIISHPKGLGLLALNKRR